jgi:hypothetical protein
MRGPFTTILHPLIYSENPSWKNPLMSLLREMKLLVMPLSDCSCTGM